jgi:hypothetical protein
MRVRFSKSEGGPFNQEQIGASALRCNLTVPNSSANIVDPAIIP